MKKYLKNRKLVTIKCDYCNNEFEKPESEYKRNLSKNRKNFCTRQCVGNYYVNVEKRKTHVLPKPRTGDEFTPFRYHFRNAKRRFKNFNLTIEDLKSTWDKQNGICPYSGVKLEIDYRKYKKINKIYLASLDRIDSTKGYIDNNIQFVSQPINYMKNNMSHEETLLLCSLIAKNHSSLS
jgi:hypothetical protein